MPTPERTTPYPTYLTLRAFFGIVDPCIAFLIWISKRLQGVNMTYAETRRYMQAVNRYQMENPDLTRKEMIDYHPHQSLWKD